MLHQVDILTRNGRDLSLAFNDVSAGIILAGIEGLDPVKATLVSTEFAMRDGTQHQASRRESRNIIIRMDLDSRYGGGSVSAIRRGLYSVFMPKTELTLTLHDDEYPPVEISGHVEIAQAPTFTKTPGFGVSILCNDPDFVDPVSKLGTGEGYPGSMIMHSVEYNGTVDSGIEFEIDLVGSGSGDGFVLQQVTPDGKTRRLIFDTPVQNFDTIKVNTHPGEKEVMLLRGGVGTSILFGIDPQSQWPILEPGTNQIGVQVTGGIYPSYYQYDWYDRYGGL